MTTWRKNEPNAIARQCSVQIFKDDGTPAPRGTDFIALGIVYVCGANTPNADAATGTMPNERRPLTFAPFTFTADSTTDVITKVAHGLETGDGPIDVSNAGGALPAPLVAATGYYFVKIDNDTGKLATTLANAYLGTTIDLTTNGTGTQTLSQDPSSPGTLTKRGMDGRFIYQATQAETNHGAAEMSIVVDDGGTGNYALKNNAGGSAYVSMDANGSVWDIIAEGSHTYGDLQRLDASILAGPVLDFTTNTLVFKSLDGTKTRWTVTVSAAGRLTVTPGDLSA